MLAKGLDYFCADVAWEKQFVARSQSVSLHERKKGIATAGDPICRTTLWNERAMFVSFEGNVFIGKSEFATDGCDEIGRQTWHLLVGLHCLDTSIGHPFLN